MHAGKASKTAQYMAFFRALESQQPPAHRLFDDPYALALLAGALRTVAGAAHFPVLGVLVRRVLELGWPGTRSSGVVRTRAIDDCVRHGINAGARQLLLLGAGFDSRGLRLEEAKAIDVFEVDHPATQGEKQKRLRKRMGRLPANIRFLPVDLESDNLEEKLLGTGFDPGAPTVAVWEGVISYLTESAVLGTLAMLGRLLAPSSSLIFTYMHRGAIDGTKAFPGARRWRSWVSFNGEPFIYGFDPDTLADQLLPLGFLLRNDASTAEIAEHDCPPLGRTEPGSPAYRVAVATRAEE